MKNIVSQANTANGVTREGKYEFFWIGSISVESATLLCRYTPETEYATMRIFKRLCGGHSKELQRFCLSSDSHT